MERSGQVQEAEKIEAISEAKQESENYHRKVVAAQKRFKVELFEKLEEIDDKHKAEMTKVLGTLPGHMQGTASSAARAIGDRASTDRAARIRASQEAKLSPEQKAAEVPSNKGSTEVDQKTALVANF